MKIIHVVTTLDPDYGGPPAVALQLAAAQAALGHEVRVISQQSPGREAVIEAVIAHTPGASAVQCDRITCRNRWQRLFARRAVRRLDRMLDERTVAHLHGVWEPIILRSVPVLRRHGAPYVLAPHGMLDPYSLSQKAWKKRLALALVYRRMINGAAAIHALNADERDLLAPLGFNPPVEVIPNGVNWEAFDALPASGSFRGSHPAVGGGPFFLFLSRLHHKKGLDVLAEAYAAYAAGGGDWSLVVVGPDGGARGDFERRIASHALAERVHVVGPLYGASKLHALRDAGAFVLPSRQEGFSIAITEALAMGLPVIVTSHCHYPEVEEVGAGIVTPLDAQPFAEAMARVASSGEAKRTAMGEAGRRLVKQRFTWPVIAERTIQLYQRLMA